jgi:hypothetical protein
MLNKVVSICEKMPGVGVGYGNLNVIVRFYALLIRVSVVV